MYGTKTTWGAGEYALMAQALQPASALVIDAVDVSAGDRVIDVAANYERHVAGWKQVSTKDRFSSRACFDRNERDRHDGWGV
jgi:hypothetical protein